MQKLVYLFELDSVRNSIYEIKKGQDALFEEIVKNGNHVVISFNQLTDSLCFLSAIKNADTYEYIIKLFELGAIRFSKTKEVGTASQYLQNAIARCLEAKKENFIFSGLPVKSNDKVLLEKMALALQYSDPFIFEELIIKEKQKLEKVKDEEEIKALKEEIKRLEYINRYLVMLLKLSVAPLASNSWKENSHSMVEFIKIVIDKYQKELIEEETLKAILPKAISILTKIYEENISLSDNSYLFHRSYWYGQIHKNGPTQEAYLAEAIVDLCYNYALEDGMIHVAKHYRGFNTNSFFLEFAHRLNSYWKDYLDGHHFFQKDNSNVKDYRGKLPPWDTASRIIRKESQIKRKKKKEEEEPVYETTPLKENRRHAKKILFLQTLTAVTTFIYIFIFVGVDNIISKLKDVLTSLFNLNKFVGIPLSILFYTILFGIISSIIASILHLPDILESIRDFFISLKDLKKIFQSPKNVTYNNYPKKKKKKIRK